VFKASAEVITERLQEAKALIVAANDPSVSDDDREKYQNDINEIASSIQSIVDSASSNGQNLLKGAGSIDVLASLNRQSDGTVEAGRVNVERQNLSTEASTFVPATVAGATSSGTTATENSAGTAPTIVIAAGETTEAQTYQVTIGDTEVSYLAEAGLDQDAIAQGFADAINSALDGTAIADTLTASVSTNTITLTNTAPVATTPGDNNVTIGAATASTGDPEGGLRAMAESLQVQQQLGVQALSIANAGPQQLLSLFQ